MERGRARLNNSTAAEDRLRWLLLAAVGLSRTACGGTLEGEPVGEDAADGGEVSDQGGASQEVASLSTSATLAACENAEDLGGGFLRCDNGLIHRAAVGTCPVRTPDPSLQRLEMPGTYGVCDPEDCTEAPYGSCLLGQAGEYCHYGCRTDAECGEGEMCFCGAKGYPAGVCVPASCSTDAECGDLLCGDYVLLPGCGYKAFACQSPKDECSVDAECGQGACRPCEPGWESCDDPSVRHCSLMSCNIGRPFLIAGAPRVAALCQGASWLAEPPSGKAGDTPPLEASGAVAITLAEAWAHAGQMEHASVAAFARFSLQLMSLGAPSDLLAATARAMQDEIAHARGCFALASRYAGRSVGPGALDVSHALEEMELRAIVETTIEEGCVGETLAALEAAEAHASCRDPETRALLARIAEEEARHAELAWRFVRWALSHFEGLEPVVRAALQRACAATVTGASAGSRCDMPSTDELRAHGVLGGAARAAVRRRALEGVVAPVGRELLAAGCGQATEGASNASPRRSPSGRLSSRCSEAVSSLLS